MPKVIEIVEKSKDETIGGPYFYAHTKLDDQDKDLKNLKETFMISIIGIGCAIVGTLLQYAGDRILGSIILIGMLPSVLTIPVCTFFTLKISLTYIFYGYWEWDADNDRLLRKKLF